MTELNLPNIPDDDINPSKIDFNRMIKVWLISFLIIFLSYILMYAISVWIIWKMSIENEKKFFWKIFIDDKLEKIDLSKIEKNLVLKNDIEIFKDESDEANAFALVWWNIIFTKELLENIKTKEEFLFILWHEIWHIESRDPIKALSRELPFYIVMWFMGFQENIDYEKILEVTWNFFSRKVELEADNYWVKFLNNLWYDANCATSFLNDKSNIFTKYLQISSTHPSNNDRVENIKKQNKIKKDCSEFKY